MIKKVSSLTYNDNTYHLKDPIEVSIVEDSDSTLLTTLLVQTVVECPKIWGFSDSEDTFEAIGVDAYLSTLDGDASDPVSAKFFRDRLLAVEFKVPDFLEVVSFDDKKIYLKPKSAKFEKLGDNMEIHREWQEHK
jgi:hypothetical protein